MELVAAYGQFYGVVALLAALVCAYIHYKARRILYLGLAAGFAMVSVTEFAWVLGHIDPDAFGPVHLLRAAGLAVIALTLWRCG